MRHTDSNGNPRWYVYAAFLALLLIAGYVVHSCAGVSRAAGDVTELHALINQYRASQGLPPFLVDARLMTAADAHNTFMAASGCFAHQCPGEADPWQRMRDAGYPSPASEVIGRGYPDAAAMLDGWQHSSGHNAILLGNWRDMGCARLDGAGGPWWTCNFGTAGTGYTPPPTVKPNPPTPAPTLDSRGPLPAGWIMRVYVPDRSLPPCSLLGVDCYRLVEADYDRSTWAVTDGLYAQYCVRGYRCEWVRRARGHGFGANNDTSGIVNETLTGD